MESVNFNYNDSHYSLSMANNDPEVFITAKAMAKMIEFDNRHPGTETIGVLIGYLDGNKLYVEDIEVGEQKGSAVHAELSESALIEMATKISERNDGRSIVGWWHTHPGLRSFMSSTDIGTQTIYQQLFPQAIAIVIDPLKFQKTLNYDDLDFGVCRVKGNEYYKINYHVIDAVPVAVTSYFQVLTATPDRKPTTSHVVLPKFNKERIHAIKQNLLRLKDNYPLDQFNALMAWLETAEALEVETGTNADPETKNLLVDMNKTLYELENFTKQSLAVKIDNEGKTTFFQSIAGMLLVLATFLMI